MRIINSSQDLNLPIRFFDLDGIQIPLNEIHHVTVKIFTYDEAHSCEYHLSDISEQGILRINSGNLARLANGCLYYRYFLSFVNSNKLEDDEYDISDVVQR